MAEPNTYIVNRLLLQIQSILKEPNTESEKRKRLFLLLKKNNISIANNSIQNAIRIELGNSYYDKFEGLTADGLIHNLQDAVNYVNRFSMPIEQKRILYKAVSTQFKLYDKIGGILNKNLQKTLKSVVNSGSSYYQIEEQITESIQKNLKSYANHAKTLTNTFASALYTSKNIIDDVDAGYTEFQYSGIAPERQFCVEHYMQIRTLTEWQQYDNKQGLNVVPYCGGYNCRHYLSGVR